MVQIKALRYRACPDAMPRSGEHVDVTSLDFDLEQVPEGGAIVKALYASLDPYMRGRMRPKHIPSYSPAFDENTPIPSSVIAQVVKSSSDKLAAGDIIRVFGPIQEYFTISSELINNAKSPHTQGPLVQKLSTSDGIPLIDYLGVLASSGLTAFSSLFEIGQPKKGETIFVSAASGAVGALVGQYAKLNGLKVFGSVGSDDKLTYITDELGFDGGFNYKTEKPADALKRLVPDGIDIYYENVGGETLQAAFDAMKTNGRIVVSGMISQYNLPPQDWYRLTNLTSIIAKCIKIQGFLVTNPNFGPKWHAEFQKSVPGWIKDGSLKAKSHVTKGIDNGPEALIEIFKGGNFGKAILEIASPGQ